MSMLWLLDVEFKDDLSRYRTGHGAKNMAIVRRFALVRADKSKGSVNAAKNRKLEPGLSAPNPSAQLNVNLDSVPWPPPTNETVARNARCYE